MKSPIGYLTTGIPLDQHYELERWARRACERAALLLLIERGLRSPDSLERFDAQDQDADGDVKIPDADLIQPEVDAD